MDYPERVEAMRAELRDKPEELQEFEQSLKEYRENPEEYWRKVVLESRRLAGLIS
ncbi:hypothetical protein [Ereboglobus sp. PH5-10]|uniref:hypothetical protein n=1 Tax=Ereboglobus sp. PH5-10 TaxID=2940629 RepID=UPI002406B8CD|nr:hypothetical protein [Ereboglobus sp. PH5-10]